MYEHSHHAGEVASAAVKATPPIAVTGMALAGLTLQEWVFAATLVYTVLLTAHLIWKFWRDVRLDRKEKDHDL